MKKKKNIKTAAVTIFLVFALVVVSALPSFVAAATKLTVSEKEYNLSVTMLPDGVSKGYAKLHDASLDAKNYELALFDGAEALSVMEEALKSAGEELSDLELLAMEVILYEGDEEGDFYPVDERKGVTVVCSVPSGMRANADKVQIVAADAKGKLQRIDTQFVEVDGGESVKFDVGAFDIYAFVYKKNGSLTGGAVPTPTKQAASPTKKPDNTPAPTKKPDNTPTPTKKPDSTPTPTKKPDSTPTPTKKPDSTPTKSPAPTKALAGTGGQSGQTTASVTKQPARDRTPQTGDDFDRAGYLTLFAAGAAVFAGILIQIGRKK